MIATGGLLDRLAGRSVLVIGDVMVDQFVIGTVDRISPEAPVPIVKFDHETWRLGGAANVANNLVVLGGQVEMVGVIGSDEDGSRLVAELARRSIGTSGIVCDPGRCTTRKLRVVTTRNQQVARIDYESDAEIASSVETAVARKIGDLASTAQAIVVSDYLKGVVSARVAAAAVEAARTHGVPILVDPKVPHIEYYAGATLITPNHHEAEAVTHMRIRTSADARDAARRFRERARCESVLITRGEQGMWLLSADDELELPAEAREVADVTGAGDTVISALALACAAGASLADAARLANRAAGIVVGKFGPATVTTEEIRQASSH